MPDIMIMGGLVRQSRFEPSAVLHSNIGSLQKQFRPGRTSSTAFLPDEDPVVQCIKQRAADFQGYADVEQVDEIQVTHYEGGQQFRNHYDWKSFGERGTTDRETTFFAYLDANCTNCGTRFPYLSYDWTAADQSWCQWVDCGEPALTIKPVPGSALFWRNLYNNGTGDRRSLHEGLPLTGYDFKTGLNIWTMIDVSP
ncbi:hypothetical protein H2200_008933 [Cladophialophora chaetospira]|uniref:Prolyl 4-hydroxylase alpha subunit domain-containing protein n=1 Tax=Cladophialophora chaetospira TaxID=386627 RepID=A0AA39CG69_9EURO|nr:hypothetical protein H2200_008933 [Cladophialophora chaetospira]